MFPKLQAAGYEKTSNRTGYPPESEAYNCIAWAANDVSKWWWPDEYSYWPFWSERKEERKNFVRAFNWLGYIVCDNSRLEPWFERVALYEMANEPQHMARQLKDGSWTSKCGGDEDITHYTLDALDSYGPHPHKAEYGCAVLYMKRLRILGWVVRIAQSIIWKLSALRGR